MKVSLTLALLACVAAVSAVPLEKRQSAPVAVPAPPIQGAQPINDVTILQFALSLEHLEAEFYLQGLNKFSEADFRRENIPNPTQTFQNLYHIMQHEVQHVKTLSTVITSLGGTPVPPCEYQFPFQTARDFLAVANSLEKVGVSAYNGALALMQNGDLQTAAATIDTVEARHASFLQTANGGDPFPENFDVALDGRQIITLASPFIKQCSFNLGFVPFAQLQIKKQIQLPETDVEVTFQKPADGKPLFCNWLFSDQSIVTPLNGNLCKIPPGARGDVYLMVTCEQTPVSLKKTDTIVAGPAIVTVDTAHTDSCKELFSGKKMKEGKVNQPVALVPPPINVPPTDAPAVLLPPTGASVTSDVPPPMAVPIDVAKQDKPVQDLFDELQKCQTGAATPPPAPVEPAMSATPPPPVDPATSATPPPPADPALVSGAPPPASPYTPPAYGASPPPMTSSPPPAESATAGPPPAYGATPPPAESATAGVPPAYGAAPPPVADAMPPTDPASGALPPAPDAYGAAPPVDPAAAPPVDPAAVPPVDPANGAYGAGGPAPADLAAGDKPVINLSDNLADASAPAPASDSDFPVIKL